MKETKFKVGDTVKVVKDLNETPYVIGSIFTVRGIELRLDGINYGNENEEYFLEEELELVEEIELVQENNMNEAEGKLKVGDKVRIIKEGACCGGLKVGDVFTISSLSESGRLARSNEGGTFWFYEIELVEELREKTQEEPPQPSTTGIKHDSGKLWPSQLYLELNGPLTEVSQVLTYGAKKYSRTNWKHVDLERYQDAMLRHMQAHFSGEKLDKESGLSHLAHMASNLLIVMWHESQVVDKTTDLE
jgi:hypothetical protein